MIKVVEGAEDGSRRVDRPVWRTEALDPAALLVDQNRRMRVFDGLAQILNKTSDLRWRLDVSLEKDKSPGPLEADEVTLGGAQLQSGCACDESPRVHVGRLARGRLRGQPRLRSGPLIPLDDALPAGSLEATAELRSLIGRAERPNHGAVVNALVAEISALDQRAPG